MSGGAEDDGRGVGLPLAAPTEKAAALKARVDDFISNKDTLRREEAEKAAEKEAEKSAAEKAAAAEAATSEAAAVESNYKEQMNTIDSQIQQKNTEIANLKKKNIEEKEKLELEEKNFLAIESYLNKNTENITQDEIAKNKSLNSDRKRISKDAQIKNTLDNNAEIAKLEKAIIELKKKAQDEKDAAAARVAAKAVAKAEETKKAAAQVAAKAAAQVAAKAEETKEAAARAAAKEEETKKAAAKEDDARAAADIVKNKAEKDKRIARNKQAQITASEAEVTKKIARKAAEEADIVNKRIKSERNDALSNAIINKLSLKEIQEEQEKRVKESKETIDIEKKARKLNEAVYPGNQGTYIATFNDVNDKLKDLIKTKNLIIKIVPIERKDYKFKVDEIGKIIQVTSGGSIHEAGLQVGDIILSFNAIDKNTSNIEKRYIFNSENKKFLTKNIWSLPLKKESIHVSMIEYITKESITEAKELDNIIKERIKALKDNTSYSVVLAPLLDPREAIEKTREREEEEKAYFERKAEKAKRTAENRANQIKQSNDAEAKKTIDAQKRGAKNAEIGDANDAQSIRDTRIALEEQDKKKTAAEAAAAAAAEAAAAAAAEAAAQRAIDEAAAAEAAAAEAAAAEAAAAEAAAEAALMARWRQRVGQLPQPLVRAGGMSFRENPWDKPLP